MPVNAEKLSAEECAFLRNIGFRVQFMRKKAGLSQAALAERSGLADSTISHLESTSVYSVSLVVLFRIAAALGVEPRALLDFD
ncbi:MAG: helix-turn-helix domain-containing protein [Oscillospiraceae bacterium]|nr:helix-turn-helix domain-containing protein [Oscillospiraceae bacterium]